jgi:hypothetical protein
MAVTGGFCPLPLRLGGDALTGWTASQHARMAADQVAKKRTAPLCVFSWTISGAGALPVVTSYIGMNGAGLAYAPTGRTGSIMTFRWDSGRFLDSYSIAYPIMPRHAVVSAKSSSYARATHVLLNDGIQIYVFDAAGVAIATALAGSCEIF